MNVTSKNKYFYLVLFVYLFSSAFNGTIKISISYYNIEVYNSKILIIIAIILFILNLFRFNNSSFILKICIYLLIFLLIFLFLQILEIYLINDYTINLNNIIIIEYHIEFDYFMELVQNEITLANKDISISQDIIYESYIKWLKLNNKFKILDDYIYNFVKNYSIKKEYTIDYEKFFNEEFLPLMIVVSFIGFIIDFINIK